MPEAPAQMRETSLRGPRNQLPPSRPPPKMGAREKAIPADPPTRTFPDSATSLGDADTVHAHPSALPP